MLKKRAAGCRRPRRRSSDITGPSLFRLIHYNSCTVGIDEAERYHSARDHEMQQIRLLLNSGYKPGDARYPPDG
ncbi:MAG: hypothetical protein HC915_15210 [Anaerolineae bacterium]|nr:hypothetical protein [Anaerolineae bacterium]